MAREQEVPAIGAEHGVVLPRRMGHPAGPRTWREAPGPAWRRSSRGLYVPADVEQTPVQRVAEAGVLLPRYAAVTGWAALAWRRARWFEGTVRGGREIAPVPIATTCHRLRPQSLVAICQERFAPVEREMVDGLWVTTVDRSVDFIMRYAPNLRAAVKALDMAAYNDLCSVDEASEHLWWRQSYTGVEQARAAVALGDENSWSPEEVGMRLSWRDAGVTTPLTNRPVFDLRGHHLATPDLIDPDAGVVGEYDSLLHHGEGRRIRDADRDDLYASVGLELVVMTNEDVADDSAFRSRVREAYRRAARRPRSDRAWSTTLPSWWVPTFTVAQRRALDEIERATWLRYRAA